LVVITGTWLEDKDARAIRAEGLPIDDAEPDARVPERAIAAVAGDDATIDFETLHRADLGAWGSGAERHVYASVIAGRMA
jgi:hypothetical protein